MRRVARSSEKKDDHSAQSTLSPLRKGRRGYSAQSTPSSSGRKTRPLCAEYSFLSRKETRHYSAQSTLHSSGKRTRHYSAQSTLFSPERGRGTTLRRVLSSPREDRATTLRRVLLPTQVVPYPALHTLLLHHPGYTLHPPCTPTVDVAPGSTDRRRAKRLWARREESLLLEGQEPGSARRVVIVLREEGAGREVAQREESLKDWIAEDKAG